MSVYLGVEHPDAGSVRPGGLSLVPWGDAVSEAAAMKWLTRPPAAIMQRLRRGWYLTAYDGLGSGAKLLAFSKVTVSSRKKIVVVSGDGFFVAGRRVPPSALGGLPRIRTGPKPFVVAGSMYALAKQYGDDWVGAWRDCVDPLHAIELCYRAQRLWPHDFIIACLRAIRIAAEPFEDVEACGMLEYLDLAIESVRSGQLQPIFDRMNDEGEERLMSAQQRMDVGSPEYRIVWGVKIAILSLSCQFGDCGDFSIVTGLQDARGAVLSAVGVDERAVWVKMMDAMRDSLTAAQVVFSVLHEPRP